jgi:hypothetical protein
MIFGPFLSSGPDFSGNPKDIQPIQASFFPCIPPNTEGISHIL